jgi:hypothetical protein
VKVTERVGDDGSVSGISWASVFDPSVNIRALGEIQARGFRAATEVVNRFVRMAGPASDTDPVDRDQSSSDSTPSAPDVDQVLQLWQRLATQAVESLRDVTRPQSSDATVDVQHAKSSGVVSLVAGDSGAVSTEVWLHNAGAEDLGKVRLRCSDLLAHNGTVIASSLVGFEPDTVPMVPRCSRGVTVQVDVPDCAGPGTYRGTLLADGHPDIWLPVVLTVLARGS